MSTPHRWMPGYSNASFTLLAAYSPLTGNDYSVRFARDARHVIGLSQGSSTFSVCVVGPEGVIYRTPTRERKPRPNRTTPELLEVLLDAPLFKGAVMSLRDAPGSHISQASYMYHTYGCASTLGATHYRPFNVRKLLRAFKGLSAEEKLRVQSWREIHLDGPVPYATSWFEKNRGLPDEMDWTEIPLDRVALALAALAEGTGGRPTYAPFNEDARSEEVILVDDVDHLIRFCPALTSCRPQIAALQGQRFPRPLSF